MGVVRSRPVMPSASTATLLAAPAIGLSLALAGLATVNAHVGKTVTHEVLPTPAAHARVALETAAPHGLSCPSAWM